MKLVLIYYNIVSILDFLFFLSFLRVPLQFTSNKKNKKKCLPETELTFRLPYLGM